MEKINQKVFIVIKVRDRNINNSGYYWNVSNGMNIGQLLESIF